MRQKSQDKLFIKYPELFRQKDLTPQETCMCWGIQCGDGWYDIIDILCCEIQRYINNKKIKQPEIEQIKSKFGRLRFHIRGRDEYIDGLVRMAEQLSVRVVETAEKQNNFNVYDSINNDCNVTSHGEIKS